MGKVCKKIISLTLIFTLLFTSNGYLFAQLMPENENNYGIYKFTYTPKQAKAEEDLAKTIKQNLNIIDDNYIRRAYKKEYNFHSLFKSINEQGFKNNYGKVCDGEICAPYHTFMRGLIGALIDFTEGDGTILINYTREIRNAAFLGALNSKDINPLRELLISGSKKTLKDCDGKDFKAQDNCQNGLAGLSILSVVWENEQQANETADLIYKDLKKYFRGSFGSLVLMEGTAALTFVDTDYSYNLLEKFLTKDSLIPGGWDILGAVGEAISPQGIYDGEEKEIEEKFNGGQRYLNLVNQRWQYINEKATKQRGIDPSIFAKSNSVMGNWDDEHVKDAYHVVYNNILTDVGEFIATRGERGQKLAKKLIKQFVLANVEERKSIHTPLILGLIQNVEFAYALPAARIINESFYYDINGGTGALIAQKSAIKGSGLNRHAKNTVSENYFLTKAKIGRVNFIINIIIQAISMGYLLQTVVEGIGFLYELAALRSLSFTVDMGAAVGQTAQIAQAGNIAQSLPKSAPALAQVETATALPQAKTVAALPQAKTPAAISQPKIPTAKPLNTSNILSKIRNGKKHPVNAQEEFSYIPLAANGLGGSAAVSPANSPKSTGEGNISDLHQSVFRLEGYNNWFSGYLVNAIEGFRNNSILFTVGHGVAQRLDYPVTVFNNLNEPIGTADVLGFEYNTNPSNGSLTDWAVLLMRGKVNAKPFDLDFDNLNKYKNVVTLSYPYPSVDLVYNLRGISPVRFNYGGNFTDNIEYLQGGGIPGESGGVVAAEAEPNKFKAIGTIIANYSDKFVYFQNLGWVKNLQDKLKYSLKDKLTIPSFIRPKTSLQFQHPIKQTEVPFDPLNIQPLSYSPASTPNTPLGFMGGGKGPSYRPSIYNPDGSFNKSILNSVASAQLVSVDDMVGHARAVWVLKDMWSRVLLYLKYGTDAEISRTKLVHEIISNSDLIKNNPLVKIRYPQILMEENIPLPPNVKNNIEMQLRGVKPSLWGSERGKVPFLMNVVEADGFSYYDLSEPSGARRAMQKLHGRKITLDEWEQFEKILEELNMNGVIHEDLIRNTVFWRDEKDVLNIAVFDWEYGPNKVANNKADLTEISDYFERLGIKESNNPGLNIRSYYY